ncbi:unnamed protein product [Heterosigma akashiwo]
MAIGALDPQVLKVSARAVSEMLVGLFLGYQASVNGVLDQPTRSALSKCTYSLFLPALLLVNVANTVASQSILTLLPLPLMAMLQIILVMGCANLLAKLLGIERASYEGRVFNVCSSFGNAGLLPMLFVNALFRGHPDPTVLPRAISSVSFFQLGWSPLFWGLGYQILQGPEKKSVVRDRLRRSRRVQAKNFSRNMRAALAWRDFRKAPLVVRVFSPPIVACFLGAALGLCPWTRAALIGEGAPLAPAMTALRTLGAAYTPAGVLVLAGSLAGVNKDFAENKGKLARTLLGISLARFVCAPVIIFGLIQAFKAVGFMPADPVLLFVLLLESCMPSAQNSVVILQVEQKHEAARFVAQTLLLLYVLALLPSSAMITYFLQMTGLA